MDDLLLKEEYDESMETKAKHDKIILSYKRTKLFWI